MAGEFVEQTEETLDYVDSVIAQSRGFTCPDAEKVLLRRCIFGSNNDEDREAVVTELSERDFSDPEYALVFRAVRQLHARSERTPFTAVGQELDSIRPGVKESVMGRIAAADARTVIEDYRDVEPHIEIIKRLAVRRRAIAQVNETARLLNDPTRRTEDIISRLVDNAERLDMANGRWTDMSELVETTHEYIERRSDKDFQPIPTGVESLDNLIGGFFPEEMTVIAARPSVGKSAFGLNLALEAAKKGFKVGFVSCEMSIEGLGQRIFSAEAKVDGMLLRKAKTMESLHWDMINAVVPQLGEMPIEFMFDLSAVEDVCKEVASKARRGEMDLVVVDYLQFMQTRMQFNEERLRVGHISHSLKRLARKAKIPVIVLAQVTREGEGTMPSMKMLRESGDIEQDADGIIFLHVPKDATDQYVHPDDKEKLPLWTAQGFKYLCLGVAKQRNGAIGQTACLFEPSLMQYIKIERTKSG